ncbi:MAG: isocitrate lyase/phosphoenolpyruvate mutase family protein [Pseudomonadota bacterium]
MTTQDFAALHTASDPLVLYNIWDAGSALAVERCGAKAIATGSLSLAGAQGFADGQQLPFEALLTTVHQIAAAIDLPLTVDFEAGFAEDKETLQSNGKALRNAGAIGCNFEDQLIGSTGLRDAAEQAERIALLVSTGLFVNARTDTFLEVLMAGGDPNQSDLVDAAIARGEAYAKAGAGCFFVPGLSDPNTIAQICKTIPIPVNVMRLPGMASNQELAALGVSRISHGPGPWRDAMASVEKAATTALAG